MKNDKQIKCRVRPFNKYGTHGAGSVIEVDEVEYRRVMHCLVSLEDEKREQAAIEAAAAKGSERSEQARAELEGYRAAFRKQHEAAKQREAVTADRKAKESASIASKLLGKE